MNFFKYLTMMLERISIASFLLLLMGAALADACSCALPKHPQQHFCNSNFVIHAYVMSRTENRDSYDAVYHVQVLDILKKPENQSLLNPVSSPADTPSSDRTILENNATLNMDNVTDATTESVTPLAGPEPFNAVLHTMRWGSLCGVHLEENKVYILGGRVSDDRLYIGLCGLHILDDEKSLNKRQRAGFFRKYKHSCDCSVEYCNGERCPLVTDDHCSVRSDYSFYDFMDCANRYSMCKRREGRCQWTKNRKHTKCQNHALRRRKYYKN